MGAGRRRNAAVVKKRLSDFCRRIPRFKKLAAAGVNTNHLLRTGGISALTYGQAVAGVAPSILLQQRRAAARAAARALGLGGHDLDLALLLADEGPRR